MAILSFPIVLPLLLTLIRFSLSALVGGPLLAGPGFVLVLLGLNLLVIALATLLFPYLWHD
jgi:heme exporter protein B